MHIEGTSDTDCAQCSAFRARRKILGLQGLSDIIVNAKNAVSEGILREIDAGPMAGTTAFADLNPKGPYDDLLLFKFCCTTCEQEFSLSAETYHGSGGFWGPQR